MGQFWTGLWPVGYGEKFPTATDKFVNWLEGGYLAGLSFCLQAVENSADFSTAIIVIPFYI